VEATHERALAHRCEPRQFGDPQRFAEPAPLFFVTYCAGPHCNGAARAAGKLARLGFAVKLMAGGVTGWLDEGFMLEPGASSPTLRRHEESRGSDVPNRSP
jgi:hypothetical protein